MKNILILLTIIFYTQVAAAEPSPIVHMQRSYKVYIKGIHIADLKAKITDNRIETIIESYGLVKKVSKYSSQDATSFTFKDDKFIPSHYLTNYDQRQGSRTVEIKYDTMGKITYEQVTPPDKRYKRPAVNDDLKKDAFDPLTAGMIARQKIIESLKNNQNAFNLNFYDGRRLARLEFNIMGREVLKINGKDQPVINVRFKRFLLAGFTNNELKRIKTEEPTFNLSLSDDDYLIPIKADIYSELGRAVLIAD